MSIKFAQNYISFTAIIEFLLFVFFGAMLLVVPSAMFPYLYNYTESSKFILFSYLLLAIGFLWLIKNCLAGHIFKINLIDLFYIIIIILVTFNRYFFHGQINYSQNYIELIELSFCYIILRRFKCCVFACFLVLLVTGGIMQSITGELQLYGFLKSCNNLFPITGSFYNPGPYAGYLTSVFPAALGIVLYKKTFLLTLLRSNRRFFTKKIKRLVAQLSILASYSAIILLPVTLIIVQSRSALTSVFLISVFLVIDKYFTNRQIYFKYRKLAGLFFLLLLLSITLFSSLIIKRDSSNGRLLIWKISARMVQAHPITGIGFDRFASEYMSFQGDYFSSKVVSQEQVRLTDEVYFAYNEPMQFLIENGSIIAIVSAVFTVLCLTMQGKSKFLLIAKTGIISILIFSLTSYPSQVLPIKINAVIYLAIMSKFCKMKVFSVNFFNRKLYSFSFLILGYVILFMLSIKTKEIYKGLQDWYTADNLFHVQNFSESQSYFNNAYSIFKNNGDFTLDYSQMLIQSGRIDSGGTLLRRSILFTNRPMSQTLLGTYYEYIKDYQMAEESYRKACDMVPSKIFPKYQLCNFYLRTNQLGKARKTAIAILHAPIKIKSTATDQIQGKMEKIIDSLK